MAKKQQYITDSEIDRVATDTRKKLAAQPKVQIFIVPKDESDKEWSGVMNGHNFRFPKGEPVSVPEDLAKMIELNNKVIRQVAQLEKSFENKDLSGSMPPADGE